MKLFGPYYFNRLTHLQHNRVVLTRAKKDSHGWERRRPRLHRAPLAHGEISNTHAFIPNEINRITH